MRFAVVVVVLRTFSQKFEMAHFFCSDFRKKAQGGDGGEGNLSNFWLKVLKASYTEFISKRDEKVLVVSRGT